MTNLLSHRLIKAENPRDAVRDNPKGLMRGG
jgi:hypothetical protein